MCKQQDERVRANWVKSRGRIKEGSERESPGSAAVLEGDQGGPLSGGNRLRRRTGVSDVQSTREAIFVGRECECEGPSREPGTVRR